jgi:hypothetical protein
MWAVDAEDRLLRRIRPGCVVLAAAFEQAQARVGDPVVQDALALDCAIDEAEQVGMLHGREAESLFMTPGCQVPEHKKTIFADCAERTGCFRPPAGGGLSERGRRDNSLNARTGLATHEASFRMARRKEPGGFSLQKM